MTVAKAKDKVTVELDDVLIKLSICGRYHVLALILIIVGNISNHLYCHQYVFVIEEVGYRCKDEGFPNGTCSNPNNSSQVCSEWIYDNPNSFVAELACQDWKRTFVGTMHSFGYMVGLLFVGPLSDKYNRKPAKFGRKKLVVVTGVLGGVLGVARSFTPWYWMFVALEFLEGVIGDFSSPLYMIGIEITANKQRLMFQMFCHFGFTLGAYLLPLSAWLFPYWKTLLRVIYTPALLFSLYAFVLDESPRWLLSKGKKEQAVAIIKKMADTNKVKLDQNLLDKLIGEESKKVKFLVLIKNTISSRSLLKRFFICLSWWTTSTFVNYGLMINSVSLQGNKYLNYALVSVVDIPGSMIVTYLLIRFKRKFPLIASFFSAAVLCFIQPFVPTNLPWLSVALYMAGKFMSSSFFNITYIFTSELFPTYTRNSMHALCSSLGRIGSILAPQTPLLMVYWPGLPSLVFGFAPLLAGFATFFIPNVVDSLPDNIRQAEALGVKSKESKDIVLVANELNDKYSSRL